ncbi:nuclear receptor coactivator 6-like [Cyprinodon tularosa]|uniref:nuclear receptor coactivator 6-like n=1 Tax=Cyprinodon tularosa TaxID=77115 RepID=UPI0018E258E2|nr:nuclear receptor coactivator 6-like [Cyprinodon tularosa]
MATDFTLDSVLVFLQSCGGSVRNSDLLLHFRPFLREHPDHVRNRELFKKFVNSVATVTKIDGVSNVVLRKKYRGHVPGEGAWTEGADLLPAGATLPAAGIMDADQDQLENRSNMKLRDDLSPGSAAGSVQVGHQVPASAPDRLVSVPAAAGPTGRHQDYNPGPVSGQEIPEREDVPEPIRGQQTHYQDPVPDPIRGQQTHYQDPVPDPIRGQQTHYQDPVPDPIRGQQTHYQDPVPDPIRGQQTHYQDPIPDPIRGQQTHYQDPVPDPIRGQQTHYQDPIPDPIRGQQTHYQDPVPDPIRGQQTHYQDPVPDPIRGQQTHYQDPVPDPIRGQQTHYQDPVPDPIRGQQTHYQDPVPDPIRGQQTHYQDPVPDPIRGQQTHYQDPVPDPIRGQQTHYQDPVPDPIRGQQTHYQDPVPDPIRGQQTHYQDPVPDPIRGQQTHYQDPVPDPIRGQQTHYQDPVPDPIRGQQTHYQDPVPDPIRGQQTHYQDPVPDPIRGQQTHYQDPVPDPIRGQQTHYQDPVPDPIRGQQTHYQDPVPDPIRGQQTHYQDPVPDPIRGQQTHYQDPVPDPIRGQQIHYQDPVPDPIRGQQTHYQDPVPDPIRGQQIHYQDPVPDPIRGQQTHYQDPVPDPIRGQQTHYQDPVPEPIRGKQTHYQDPVPDPIRAQQVHYQEQIFGPTRGRIVLRQDYKPELTKGEEMDLAHVPTRRSHSPHQGTIPEANRGHIVSRQDHVPNPVQRWDPPPKGTFSEPFRGHVGHKDHVQEHPGGHRATHQDLFRGQIINRHVRFPGPVRGQRMVYQGPVLAPIRGAGTAHQDPIQEPFRENFISQFPRPFRGQNIPYEDMRGQPFRGWDVSPHIPMTPPIRRGQIQQNPELLRGQPIPYQVPVPEPIRAQRTSYPNSNPELGREQQIQQNPEPLRGPKTPQNPKHLIEQISSDEEPIPEPLREQKHSNQELIPEPVRGQQVPQNPEPVRKHQVPQNPEPVRKHQVPQNPEPVRKPQVPQNPEPVRGHQVPQNPEPVGQQVTLTDPDPKPVGQKEDQPPLPHTTRTRRFRHRPSYKTAISQDEDYEEEDEEEAPTRRASAGGPWPLSGPLGDAGRTLSTSSPCITEVPTPLTSSSGRKVPQIYIQDSEILAPQAPSKVRPRLEPGPVESMRRSLPSDVEGHFQASQSEHHPAKHPARASEPGPGLSRTPPYSSVSNPPSDGRSSLGDCSPSWTSSSRGDGPAAVWKSQEVLQESSGTKPDGLAPRIYGRTPLHQSMGNLYDEQPPLGELSQLYHSTDHLHDHRFHDDRQFPLRGKPVHLSSADLYDDAESSDGSINSPHVKLRPSAARRMSSRLRNRNCQSLGTDLDHLHLEKTCSEIEAARLQRLQRISSSLSLPHHLSSSSLSSCATPPRCPSPVAKMEVEGRKEVKRNLHYAGESPLPLDANEHAWMVKGAAGAWPDIYTLFRDDASLLNKQDFISGFTVLHWIAKHGDHRVLNTLWYGVEQKGLTFNIDAKSTGGQTPLHIAAIHGHKNIIRLLVKKFGANVKLRDMAGKKPWQYLSDRSPDILQLLGAPPKAALVEEAGSSEPDWKPTKQRRRHHLSSASSAQRPRTVAQMVKVSRSSSIAALLKHKSHRF